MILTCWIVPSVFDLEKVEKKGIKGLEAPVPSRIDKLNIKFKSDFKLRAVVIFEHQNLNLASEAIKLHTKGIMVIQVCQSHMSPLATFGNLA